MLSPFPEEDALSCFEPGLDLGHGHTFPRAIERIMHNSVVMYMCIMRTFRLVLKCASSGHFNPTPPEQAGTEERACCTDRKAFLAD